MRLALCVISVLATALPSVQAADFIRVGSFNIEHFGKRTPAQQPIAIAEHIDLSGVDVLGMQELYVTETANDTTDDGIDQTRRNAGLDTAFAILNSEGDTDWQYEIFPNRNAGDTSQLCGVAWNAKRITRKGKAFAIDLNGLGEDPSKIWDRRPHAVMFSYGIGKTDFVLIPVHMKSNYGGASDAKLTRKAEAKTLTARLGDVSEHFDGEKEIIIAGDTNFLEADEPAAQQFIDANLRDTNPYDVPTYIGSSKGAPFDRFYLTRSPILTFARQYVLQAAEAPAHDQFLSDHQMVVLSFRVKSDNDP